MSNTIYITIIAIYSISFVFNFLLSKLNSSWFSKKPSELVGDIFESEQYNKQQSYNREKDRVNDISSAITFVSTLIILMFGYFGKLDIFLSNYIDNQYLQTIAFFGVIGFASSIISIPFSYYQTFKIESKYNFNKSTLSIFISDYLKSAVLGAVIGFGLLSAMLWIYNNLNENFWWIAWLLISAFSIFINFFYSSLIVPLFNKQKALDDGELKTAISDFAKKAGFKLDNIYVIDGSKRSSKANAYFSGFGSKKRIVLFDTLIDQLSTEEIVAVLAHEIGHYKKKHTIFNMLMGIIQTGFILYILSYFLANQQLSIALGGDQTKFHLSLMAFAILFSPVSEFTSIFMNIISRKFEFQADAYAASFKLGDSLVSGLKTLSKNSFSNLTPHPWYVFVNYSHPPLDKRIKRIFDSLV